MGMNEYVCVCVYTCTCTCGYAFELNAHHCEKEREIGWVGESVCIFVCVCVCYSVYKWVCMYTNVCMFFNFVSETPPNANIALSNFDLVLLIKVVNGSV